MGAVAAPPSAAATGGEGGLMTTAPDRRNGNRASITAVPSSASASLTDPHRDRFGAAQSSKLVADRAKPRGARRQTSTDCAVMAPTAR